MDGDVQQHYLAAEQAYGDGNFAEAQSIASTLLAQLNTASNSAEEEEARLAWRAFVTLLLGHIHFHGLNQPEQALAHYQLALENQPPDTLRELAEQGIDRCEEQIAPPPLEPESSCDQPVHPQAGMELIRDPFLGTTPLASDALHEVRNSATPWLGDDDTTATSPNPSAAPSLLTNATAHNKATAHTLAAKANPAPGPDPNSFPDEEMASNNTAVAVQTTTTKTPPTDPPIDIETIDLSPWLLRRRIGITND